MSVLSRERMSLMPKIPPYSMEFKREAVKLLRSGDRTVPAREEHRYEKSR